MEKKNLPLYNKVLLSTGMIILAVLFAVSCAGGPEERTEEVEKTEKREKTEVPEEASAEKVEEKPEYQEVKEKVLLVEKKSSYYPDGVLDEYRLFTYRETGTELLKEELFNSEDEIQERNEYSYEDGNCIREATMDAGGGLLRFHEYSYNEEGLLVEDRLYNGEEDLQSISRFEYDSKGRKVKWSIYDGSETLLAYTEYRYEDGNNTEIQNYSATGEIDDYFVLEYDEKDRKIKETWYNASGDVEEYSVYEYSDNALAKEVRYRSNDSVKRKVLYINNSAGKPEEVVYMDGGDNVQEKVSYEYIERIRTKMVPVE